MLQGPVGPFFWLLARRLSRHGVAVHKINLNGGDTLFFPGPNTRFYRGWSEEWPNYLAGLISDLDIDAIALFGDCRSRHRAAIAVAGQRNIPVFTFEEGYLRPDHITVELGGVNGYSQLMNRALVPMNMGISETVAVGNSFPALAAWSVLYSIAKDAVWVVFPHFHRPQGNSVKEGMAYLRSGLRKLLGRGHDRRRIEAVRRSGKRYFLLPLQIYFDSQITEHSPFLSVAHIVTSVIRSFAGHAPLDAMLLIKHHPLDRGHCSYRDVIERTARNLGCNERVIYFAEGHLPSLLEGAAGTVTCNSTVGLSSLWHGTPVKPLGRAVYNRPGLTAQNPLDEFWSAPGPVNKEKVSAFIDSLKGTCQANGSFYTGYRRTGVFDAVIARMADQYEHAMPATEQAWSYALSVTPSPAPVKTGGDLVPLGLYSSGARKGAE
jgi:capsular polysaccharide export protein